MNKAQKKILEAVGVLSKNRIYYSAFSKKHVLDVKGGRSEVKIPSFICSKTNNCLILAESWFRERGLYLSWGAIGSAFLLSICVYFSAAIFLKEGITNVPATLAAMTALVMGWASAYPLFFAAKSELKKQGLQYAIFNTESKNIYFVSDLDFQSKTCRWEECTFCIAYSAGSIEGRYYELRGYLFNDDGSVRDSFSFDDYHYMTTNSEQHRQLMVEDLSARFEYVRRFMEDGADSVEPVTGHLDLKPSLSEAAHRFQPRSKVSDGKKFHIIYSIVRTVFLIPFSVQVVGHYFFCRYCRLPEWPQSVIDECGKEVFPRR
ncbi:hypothetical protein [Kushneria phyllosphaerae]|uniref:Uncharacterized protein n=1 Tax=Kushneria phyllosphaerae TaxID=2100822 RepID=A0A2R8CKY0_9GAMM|nr:hypothetical protein [Kushneria phyllosphaerae]SPJ33556.1 hypothetical protein KSP9073_01565 [Kushneria phyllosphaerae]